MEPKPGIQIDLPAILARTEQLAQEVRTLLQDRQQLILQMQGLQQQLAHIPSLAAAVMDLHQRSLNLSEANQKLWNALEAVAKHRPQNGQAVQGYGSPAENRVPPTPNYQGVPPLQDEGGMTIKQMAQIQERLANEQAAFEARQRKAGSARPGPQIDLGDGGDYVRQMREANGVAYQ